MDSSGYRSDGVGLAVAIVNAVYGTDSDADDGELLEKSLHEYGVMNRALSAREKAGLRGWAGHLHNVFAADSASEGAHLLNQLLDVVVTHPYLTDHGGRLHLHYAPAEADPLHRVQASTAMGLGIVLCDYGMARLGVCRAVKVPPSSASACSSASRASTSSSRTTTSPFFTRCASVTRTSLTMPAIDGVT